MKKKLAGILVTAAMSALFASTAWAEWQWDTSNSTWYYYSQETGEKMTGWQEIEGKWYYLEPDNYGAMHTGWLVLNNKRYFCDFVTGAMKSNENFCTCDLSHNPPVYGDGFLYQVDVNGELVRKGESINPYDSDEKLIHCDDGRIKIKDAITKASGTATGDTFYQYLLCPHYEYISDTQNEEDIRNGVIEYTELFNERYIEKVKTASARTRQEKWEKWKESVARRLRQLRVEDEWIEKYYEDVRTGKFENGDEWVEYMERKINGDWVGDYEDDDDEWDD